MRKIETSAGTRLAASATLVMFTLCGCAGPQAPPAAPVSGAPAAQAPATAAASSAPMAARAQPAAEDKTFSQQELDQLLAPIALYPDSLLAQVLMASTYPLEIVSAERWVRANPGLKDKALEDALQKQSWDPSVKSLTVFPQVLNMMSEKLEWTQKVGDAFLAQQKDVMATAQALRAKAVAEGTLKDSNEQKVVTQKTESTTIIMIEPANPEVVYVPTYNPALVYGAWPYPAYPPYYYYPPGYVAGGALLGFTAGIIVGGALWGNLTWGGGSVDIDVNRYNNFNRTNISNKNWQHNAEHRGAVPYRDKGVAKQYNRGQSPGAQARDSYRGRSDIGGQFAKSGDAAGRGAGSFDRRGSAGQSFSRDYSGTRGNSAFDTGSRAQTRDYSSRGSSSMSSARSSAGASRASAGGMRGGGGGRGGGGRR
jgi:Protein of unknown function (DUF3300)